MEAMATTKLFSPSPLPTSQNFSSRTLLKSSQRVSIKAMAKGVSRSRRRTLSSNWDLSERLRKTPTFPSNEHPDANDMLLQQRIVFLGTKVEPMTADLIVSQLLVFDAMDSSKEIKLFINSPGGSVVDGMAIYDAMKVCRADISTYCLGIAANVAAFILACGTPGKRFCMPNSRVMIQQPFCGGAGGKISDLGVQIREMMYQRTKMLKIFSRVTGKPQDQIDLDTDHENFMDPWQAKEYGLVDVVIDEGKPGLIAPRPAPTGPPEVHYFALKHRTFLCEDLGEVSDSDSDLGEVSDSNSDLGEVSDSEL